MEIIDRLEGELAVVETDAGFLHIPRSALPEGAREGDVLRKTEGGFVLDPTETQRRRASLAARRRRMRGGNSE